MSTRTETAKYLIDAISAVNLAASWLVQDDEAWISFRKWVDDFTGLEPLPEEAQKGMDDAIAIVDEARQSIARHNNLDPGLTYPRKYR